MYKITFKDILNKYFIFDTYGILENPDDFSDLEKVYVFAKDYQTDISFQTNTNARQILITLPADTPIYYIPDPADFTDNTDLNTSTGGFDLLEKLYNLNKKRKEWLEKEINL